MAVIIGVYKNQYVYQLKEYEEIEFAYQNFKFIPSFDELSALKRYILRLHPEWQFEVFSLHEYIQKIYDRITREIPSLWRKYFDMLLYLYIMSNTGIIHIYLLPSGFAVVEYYLGESIKRHLL